MNTVKRWLAGFLSFAMIFTSAAFSNVGAIVTFAKSNAIVVTTDDGVKNYASANGVFDTALNETVDKYNEGGYSNDGINHQNEKKAAVITLNENASTTATKEAPKIINIPLIIDLNGYKLDKYQYLVGGSITIDNTTYRICKNIIYNDKAYPTKITFAIHKAETVYNWVHDPGINPAWYVKTISYICPNCGLNNPLIDDGDTDATKVGKTSYNADKNRYEFKRDSDGKILSTHKSEVDVDGWYMTTDPYIVAVNGVYQHTEDGLPIVKAVVTKISTGEEKLVDVALTKATDTEINDALKKEIYGFTKGNQDPTCEEEGAIVYKAVVSDPDGNVLNTTFIRDDQAANKLDHVQGAAIGVQLATRSDESYDTAIAAKKMGLKAKEEAFIETEKVETKDADGKVIETKYYYRYWANAADIKGAKSADQAVTLPVDKVRKALKEDGSFDYRMVYECDIAVTPSTHDPLYGDIKTVTPLSDDKAMALTTYNSGYAPACTNWYYPETVEPYTFATGTTKTTRKATISVVGEFEKTKATHVAASFTPTSPATCLDPEVGTIHCKICGNDIENVKGDKTLPHIYSGYSEKADTLSGYDLTKMPGDDRKGITLNKEGTEATIKATCEFPGGTYLYCVGNPSGQVAPHWVLKTGTGVEATGHTYVTETMSGYWNAYEFTNSGEWKEIEGKDEFKFAFDDEHDYTFTTTRHCSVCNTNSEEVTYHYTEGVDTDTDIYKAIDVKVTTKGTDCQTKGVTTYTVEGITYPGDKPITKEVETSLTPGDHKYKVTSWNWADDYESATITGDCTVEGCNAAAAHPGSAMATVTQTTGEDGITTFTATYKDQTDVRKAFTLKNAVVTFDASGVKDANLVAGLYSKDYPGYAAPSEEPPAVTVTINGTVIDPSLYDVTWESWESENSARGGFYPIAPGSNLNQGGIIPRVNAPKKAASKDYTEPGKTTLSTARWLKATVDWTDEVKESGIEVLDYTASSKERAASGKLFIPDTATYETKDGKTEKIGQPTQGFTYDPEKSYSVETKATIYDSDKNKYVEVKDATVKYAVVTEEIGAYLSEKKDDPWVVQKKIESLDFDLDSVEGLKDAGTYYVFVQISGEGFTTGTGLVDIITINKKSVIADIDDLFVVEGTEPDFNIEFFKFDKNGNKKVVTVDRSEYSFKTLGGAELTALTPGFYKVQVVSNNYEVTTEKYGSDYVCVLEVISMDDTTAVDQAKAKAAADQIEALLADPTAENLAKARELYDKLPASAKARFDAEVLKKLTDAEAAAQAKKDADAAIAAAKGYESDAAVKAALDALNAALAKGDTTEIKNATNTLNAAITAVKDAAAAKDAANAAIAAAKGYESDAAVKAALDALNAALAKGDTAAIKTATANLNNAVTAAKNKKAEKSASKITFSTKKKTIKASKVKKKAQKFQIKIKKTGNGKVTYKKSSGSKKLSVSKSGKITVKKGTKKGTYKIKVKATIAETSTYKKATKSQTIKVKVK